MTEIKIYVGLNDSVTMQQEHNTDTYINILKNVCRNYQAAFSFSVVQGGYIHEDGQYTQENSLIISMIDPDPVSVNEIAKDLCVFFHQESVLITEGQVRAYYVNEKL